MTLAQQFLAELKQEAIATRKIIALVPFEKADWQPHEKSMKLVQLARHVAEIPSWVKVTIEQDELDFAAPSDRKPFKPASTNDLLDYFDQNMKEAEEVLNRCSDADLERNWTMRQGDQVFFTLPKGQVVRTWCLNHWYHHRAQLGVFLRLNNIPLPATYGPSADAMG